MTEQFFVRVAAIQDVADGSRLYSLTHAQRAPLPRVEAGSHIALRLPNGLERQYSILRAGDDLATYEIAVKRDPASRGGSSYIHERLRLGAVLRANPPRNNFPLNEGAEHSVLVAGGIGITPILSMARRLTEIGRDLSLHYACRTRADAPFLDELTSYGTHFHFDDERHGRSLDLGTIFSGAPIDSHLYCCGPAPMLEAFEAAAIAQAVKPERVHVEHFKPRIIPSLGTDFDVELARSGHVLHVTADTSILDAVLAVGVEMNWSCAQGICGACETRVLEGIPEHRDSILSPGQREENRTMFICCSRSLSKRLVLDL